MRCRCCKTRLFLQVLFLGVGVIRYLMLLHAANKSLQAGAEAGCGSATGEVINLRQQIYGLTKLNLEWLWR